MRPKTAVRTLLVSCLAFASARTTVHSQDLTFRPSQFHTESAAVASDTGAKAGTVPRSARTRGTVPVFAGPVPRYEVVLGEGMDVTDEAGAPQLPVQPIVIALPGHQEVTNVTFEVGEWQALEGQHLVLPCQKQEPLVAGTDLGRKSEFKLQNAKVKTAEEDGVGFTQPNPAIYASHSAYPSVPARWTGTSYKVAWDTIRNGGHFGHVPRDSTYVQVLVYPVRYIGAERRIEVCREVKVKVEAENQTNSEARSQRLEAGSPGAVSREPLAGGPFEYVVVTGAGLDTVFQRLADWKTAKGVPAVVRTMDWVYAYYTGRDQAEQLRNYLKTLPDSGVKYVLLGGDVDVVPFRKAFAMASEWGADPREDSLPCDLYFADLQGSWDANNNNVFGEVDDSVNLYADLSVGRAPVNSVAQAQIFDDGYQRSIL